jgi:hypothetical protein
MPALFRQTNSAKRIGISTRFLRSCASAANGFFFITLQMAVPGRELAINVATKKCNTHLQDSQPFLTFDPQFLRLNPDPEVCAEEPIMKFSRQ